MNPTLSFGTEGNVIPLNLNASMPDGSETATLTVHGLGQYAAFSASGTPVAASYDAGTDTYTLSGISSTDINNLGFVQAAQTGTLTITAYTIDGASTSATTTQTLPVDISAKLATSGDDTLLYHGTALNGLAGVDVVQFRLGENLDFAASPVKPSNIEVLDLMPTGQNHSLSNLRLQDVLDMTDPLTHTLKILGDTSDSVTLKQGAGNDQWAKGAQVTENGHVFDIYTNTHDASVTVKIEHDINAHIV
jgi:hypothetical protein